MKLLVPYGLAFFSLVCGVILSGCAFRPFLPRVPLPVLFVAGRRWSPCTRSSNFLLFCCCCVVTLVGLVLAASRVGTRVLECHGVFAVVGYYRLGSLPLLSPFNGEFAV